MHQEQQQNKPFRIGTERTTRMSNNCLLPNKSWISPWSRNYDIVWFENSKWKMWLGKYTYVLHGSVVLCHPNVLKELEKFLI